jgi:hypothetical protein
MTDFKGVLIQGIEFEQADILGNWLPSTTSIKFIFTKYKDKRIKENFRIASDAVVITLAKMFSLSAEPFDRTKYEAWFKNLDWGNMSIADINSAKVKVDQSQCELVGYSFSRLVQCLFIEKWFDTLLSSSGAEKRESGRVTEAMVKISADEDSPHTDEIYTTQKARLKPIRPNISLAKCQEYQDTRACLQEFDSIKLAFAMKLSLNTNKNNHIKLKIMQSDVIRFFELEKISHKTINQCEHKRMIFCCERCQIQSLVKQMPKSNICSLCRNKRKEEKKIGRRKPHKVWVSDEVGVCKRKCDSVEKSLDKSSTCEDCHRKRSPSNKR